MPELIIIGNCCADIYIPAHQPPPPGGIERIPQVRVEIGGNGANTAVTAARLGASTALAGVLGADLFGCPLRQALASEGIDLSLLDDSGDTHDSEDVDSPGPPRKLSEPPAMLVVAHNGVRCWDVC